MSMVYGVNNQFYGWWYTYLPLLKMMEFKSDWDDLTFPRYPGSHKIHVPNHQPVLIIY
jgi:hypothetical protein